MCTRPKLIINPQSKYLLHNADTTYVCGCQYFPYEVLSKLRVDSLVSPFDVDTCSPEDILFIKDSSYIVIDGNRFPLFISLPCGKCQECRSDYRKEIENRALIEASHCGTVIFYTLTYDDYHLPTHGLNKKHVVSAFKRLRTHIDRYLDFPCHFTNLYVGEYGTNSAYTLRPHYHGLLFIRESLTPQQIFKLWSLFFPFGRSDFYQKHSNLKHWWYHGERFDFEVARSVPALVRYVTKYITKQFLFNDDSRFAVAKERDERHWTQPFVQMPKSIGLGCRCIDYYKDFILKSTDMSITINCHGKYLRIGIPRIFIQKIFPSLGKVCVNAIYYFSLANRLIRRMQVVGFRDDEISLYKSWIEKYDYLGHFDIKSKQRRHLESAYIYYDRILDRSLIRNLFENIVLNHLSTCYTTSQFYENIQLKSSFYKNKVLPDTDYQFQVLDKRLKAECDVNYTKNKLIDSAFDSFC